MRGYKMMLQYLQENSLPYELCGKIIVAKSITEIKSLEQVYQNGLQVGLNQLEWLDASSALERQAGLRAVAGIWVPYTGITDYVKVCHAISEEIQARGVHIFCSHPVEQIQQDEDAVSILSNSNRMTCGKLILCTGLWSDSFIRNKQSNSYRVIPFEGKYYELVHPSDISLGPLLYPVPHPEFPFLGIHWTRHIDGSISLGPNAVPAWSKTGKFRWNESFRLWTSVPFLKLLWNYRHLGIQELLKRGNTKTFAKEGSAFGLTISANRLMEKKPGIRALLVDRRGLIADDFIMIQDQNILNVMNAPSPAATSSLSIANRIVDELTEDSVLKIRV